MKCETCAVYKRVLIAGDEPVCCAWYLENVICGEKSVSDCTDYEKED